MQYKVALLSLGCKVNSYETERIREDMAAAGFEIVDFSEKADVYIVNTCSVTNIADRKSRQMLHRAKSQNEEAMIVATGCYVQTEKNAQKLNETADILIGNNHKSEIAKLILSYLYDRDKTKIKESVKDIGIIEDISCEKNVEDMSIEDYPERSRAFVRIEDGCNQFCSYCIIPYARGRVRSRNEEDIIKEVEKLAGNGFKEVVLTGIHISSYGFENYEKMIKNKQNDSVINNYDTQNPDSTLDNVTFNSAPLLKLIKRISKVEGIERIRLSSLEPRIITKEFAEQLKAIPSFCPHFHLSLQSGCDSVLKRMNRHYTSDEFLEKCRILRNTFDRPAITTDVIVGFPGETEQEFGASYDMCKNAAFAKMHIFKYSRRKGTVADRMPGQLTENQKHERSLKLQALDEEMQEAYVDSFIGESVKILVEERKDGYYQGLTERYVEVRIQTEDNDESDELINSIAEVYISGKAAGGILLGRFQKNT